MRPILYSGDETLFTSEGRGRLADCTRCIVTEERNGIYLCEFDYPVTGPMYAALLEGGIVGVIHDDNHDIQPFDIYGHTAPLDGVVTFYASHISYRLSNIILRPMTADSCANALAAFETQTYNRNPFSFWTDKAVSGAWKNDVPSSVKACLGGQQGSILDVYGKGEYQFDRWTVRLYTNRGNDNGVSIRYGVNLTSLTEDVDASEMYTAVAPYWKSADGSVVVTLPEGFVVAGEVPVKTYPWTTETGEIITTEDGTPIEFSVAQIMPVPMDLTEAFQDAPTVAQLRAAAQSRLNSSEAWLPKQNIKISFVDLAHTEDYKDVAALQRVSLCDRVNVYCGPLGVTAAKVQVVRVVYNVLTEQYDEIELGQPRTNFADTIMARVEQLVAGYPSMDVLEGAIDSATRQITGATDSHVKFVYDANGGLQEILIMDTDDIATARKIWRWNSGGLGYSSNGYAGPYGLAITQDGAIVADFITTGALNAGIIKTGTLSADRIAANSIAVGKLTGTISGGLNNSWVLDLTNGTLTIGNISAANITTGTLSADRIAANSIAVGKLTGTISGGLNNSWVLDLTNGTLTIGNISAANITTGTMVADRISGGTLKLGGDNNINGSFTVIDSQGRTIGTWDNNGINITKGGFAVTSGYDTITINTDNIPFKIAHDDTAEGWEESLEFSDGVMRMAYGNASNAQRTMNLSAAYGLAFKAPNNYSIGISIDTSPNGNSLYGAYIKGNEIRMATAGHSGTQFLVNAPASGNTSVSTSVDSVDIFGTNCTTSIYGRLTVYGTKSRVVQTDQYADRLLYCYETPSPMFGDVGEGVIGVDGMCYVAIDPVFAQTIATNAYQVFLQRYGDGDCYVKERRGGWFVVSGTPGLSFGWEIKAKQRDYDQRRLERNDEPFTVPAQSYGADAAAYIDDLKKARISA